MSESGFNIDKPSVLNDLMFSIKVHNPDISKEEMLKKIGSLGPEWQKISVEQIRHSWKRMKKRISKLNKKYAESEDQCIDITGDNSDSNSMLKTGSSPPDSSFIPETESSNVRNLNSPSSSNITSNISQSVHDDQSNINGVVSTPINSALQRQLDKLKDIREEVQYVLFTPQYSFADYGIKFSDEMGQIFFKVMWNQVLQQPRGSDKAKLALWMMYQQLEPNVLPRYKVPLREQLKEEFGFDPFEGENIGVDKDT